MPPSQTTAAKLLVVDDSVTVRMSLRDLLVKQGYEVLLADSGEAALELLRSESIDVLMLDLIMPGGGGRDLLKEIKADEKLASIPVILLTAVSNAKEIAECREIGFDEFISKPWDEAELLGRLRTIAQRKHAADKPDEQEEKPRVLIVDDSLRDLLVKHGCEVFMAESGWAALKLLRSESIDVLMLDLVMKEGHGRDLLKEIKADAKLASIPVILLAAVTDRKEIAECQEIGVDDFISKPWDEAELLARLRTMAQLKQTADKPGGAPDRTASTSEGTGEAAADPRAQDPETEPTTESDAAESTADSDAEAEAEPAVEEQQEERPRVLVVDDSMTVCMRLTEELQAGGMDAVATDKAQDALLRVQREEFDVAITDVVMPCMDGEELIQRLGKLAPQLPCIVLTGSAEMAAVRRLAKVRNVVGILVKPWDRGRLMDTLKSALERRERSAATMSSE